ncbi:uncharacterized protein [Excalfactoria chinensis]|uniref:uncharacterized protein isoform X2 n=1 Tax=Excalfactoria chinensis TaxID=46218 RepID=UPI003B3A84E7
MSVRSQAVNSTTMTELEFEAPRETPVTRRGHAAPSQAVTPNRDQPPHPAPSFPSDRSLSEIREYVHKFRGTTMSFKKPQRFHLRLGGLEGSFYEGQEELKEYCEVLYLKKPTRMEVVGTVDDVPCLAMGQQLVILVAETKEVYAYEEDTLHKVAKNMDEFLDIGLQNLGKEVYYCGENVVALSEKERDRDPTIQQLRQSAQRFLESGKKEFQHVLGSLEKKSLVAH